MLTFDHIEGAERAYADARGRADDAPWLREVVFVECHRHGRIVVRGTFAGHYLDVDDVADAIGRDTAVGGWRAPWLASRSGRRVSRRGWSPVVSRAVFTSPPFTLRGRAGCYFDEIRHHIPEGSSGIVALVSADDSAALIEALHERAARLRLHHRLSDAEAAALQAAVGAGTPGGNARHVSSPTTAGRGRSRVRSVWAPDRVGRWNLQHEVECG